MLVIRRARFFDIPRLFGFYKNLLEKTKREFHPFYFRPEPTLRFLVSSVCLFLSTISPIRTLLKKIYPRAAFFLLLAFEEDEIVGLAYLQGQPPGAALGIVVKGTYRERRIGSKLMEVLLSWGKKENFSAIFLMTNATNKRAVEFYQKFGFVTYRYLEGVDSYCGEKLDCVFMKLEF